VSPDLEYLLERFARACLDVLGEERVEGIILHGSAVKGGGIPGYSDIDFMVFLSPDCFDSNGDLPDDAVFAIQERIGPLPWREAGFLYPQAYFHDSRRLPDWWTGPVPGAYRVLWGHLPTEAQPTPDGLRTSSLRFLKKVLPQYISRDLGGFIDAPDDTLPRRVRLLGTSVAPTIYALLGHDAVDVMQVWALPKNEALRRLEERHPSAEGPAMARRFYRDVARLYEGEFDAGLGRRTFRAGITFLRWAERVGRSLAEPAV
jgi:Nucleotidyltransferase domain